LIVGWTATQVATGAGTGSGLLLVQMVVSMHWQLGSGWSHDVRTHSISHTTHSMHTTHLHWCPSTHALTVQQRSLLVDRSPSHPRVKHTPLARTTQLARLYRLLVVLPGCPCFLLASPTANGTYAGLVGTTWNRTWNLEFRRLCTVQEQIHTTDHACTMRLRDSHGLGRMCSGALHAL
jgi:hypothetical protein